jgi:Tat protein secretion system quality control protein TatD with DNase activity
MTLTAPRDLNDALAAEPNVWTREAQARVRERLQLAASGEWAQATLNAWDRGPDAFLLHHFQSSLEHAHTAIGLYRALGEVTTRTGTESLDEALAQLGITEEQWLTGVGFTVFDQHPKEAP